MKKGNEICIINVVIVFLLVGLTTLSSQIAKSKGKWIGNVINSSVPTNFNTYWNQVTPENAGKWGSVENVRDQMQWATLDRIYAHAKSAGIPFKYHTFVWGQQEPAYIKTLSSDEYVKEIESYIIQACERYPDIDYIDVVNEPLHAPPYFKEAIGGNGTTGWDWVIWAFEKARKYCPKAKLVLNDYNIFSNDVSTTAYINIIEILKSKNLIDIVGEQGHFMETTPIETIKRNLARVIETGLPIHISEFDVHILDDQAQLNKYKELFPIFWENPAVKGITLWGYIQGQIWRTNGYLLTSDNTERSAMVWLKGYINLSTAIHHNAALPSNIKILGNPILDNILRLQSSEVINKVDIISTDGKCMYSSIIKQSGNIHINLPIIKGLYFAKLSTENSIYTTRLVIE